MCLCVRVQCGIYSFPARSFFSPASWDKIISHSKPQSSIIFSDQSLISCHYAFYWGPGMWCFYHQPVRTRGPERQDHSFCTLNVQAKWPALILNLPKWRTRFSPGVTFSKKREWERKKKVNRLKKCVLICVIKGGVERKMYLLWTDRYGLCFTVLMWRVISKLCILNVYWPQDYRHVMSSGRNLFWHCSAFSGPSQCTSSLFIIQKCPGDIPFFVFFNG